MNVDRGQPESGGKGLQRVGFCLARLEEANGFKDDLEWSTQVVDGLTLEEMIGALVAAEQDLGHYDDMKPLIQDINEGWV